MNDYDDNQLKERFGPIIDGLEGMAQDLRSTRYPGIAWHGLPKRDAKRPAWRLLVWPAAAAAIAAAILLAIFVFSGPGHKSVPVGPAPVANAPEPREDDLLVMEMLVGDAPEIDWNYKLWTEDEYRWFMNEMATSSPALDG